MSEVPSIQALVDYIRRIARVESAVNLLGWDQEVTMPSGGTAARAGARGELAEISHRMWIANELSDLIQAAEADREQASDDRVARLVDEVRRRQRRKLRVSPSLTEEIARVTSEAQQAWQGARKASDFAAFEPMLTRVLDLKKRFADAVRDEGQDPYEALMDDYEPGARLAEIRATVDEVRPRIVELVKTYAPRCEEVRHGFLSRDYPVDVQERLGRAVLERIGYRFDRGVLAVSTHPFCSGIASPFDVRVTTRYAANEPTMAWFGTIHEGGHALFEQGFDEAWHGTPIAEALSMSIHESQSRLWENVVGRSRGFWQHFYPMWREAYPDALHDVGELEFVRAVNRVEPSLIRVEADEVTYNLHVMLRFEIEQGLFEGSLAVADLPGIWNERMQEYLGLTPPDDAQGVLQDIHWSFGAFGYFPTYFLGNLYAAQIFDAAHQQLPGLDGAIARGEFEPLRDWLAEQIHRYGSVYSAQETCERVTGAPLDSEHLSRYLTEKLEDLFGDES